MARQPLGSASACLATRGLCILRLPCHSPGQKHRRHRRLERRSQTLLLASASVAVAGRSTKKEAASEVWTQILQKSIQSLRQITSDWEALEADADAKTLEALERREKGLRELLKRCPWGDPAATASAPRHQSRDSLVAAHGLATRAVLQCQEQKLQWQLHQNQKLADQTDERSESAADTKGRALAILSALALHRFRLFDIEGAHAALTSAADLQVSCEASRLDFGLLEYSTKLLAARSPAFLSKEQPDAELALVRKRLLEASYTESVVLEGSGAACLTEFVLARSGSAVLEERRCGMLC